MPKKKNKYYAVSFGMAGNTLLFKTLKERTKVIKAVISGVPCIYSTWNTFKSK